MSVLILSSIIVAALNVTFITVRQFHHSPVWHSYLFIRSNHQYLFFIEVILECITTVNIHSFFIIFQNWYIKYCTCFHYFNVNRYVVLKPRVGTGKCIDPPASIRK